MPPGLAGVRHGEQLLSPVDASSVALSSPTTPPPPGYTGPSTTPLDQIQPWGI